MRRVAKLFRSIDPPAAEGEVPCAAKVRTSTSCRVQENADAEDLENLSYTYETSFEINRREETNRFDHSSCSLSLNNREEKRNYSQFKMLAEPEMFGRLISATSHFPQLLEDSLHLVLLGDSLQPFIDLLLCQGTELRSCTFASGLGTTDNADLQLMLLKVNAQHVAEG